MALPQKSFYSHQALAWCLCRGIISETVLTVSAGKEGQTVETVFCFSVTLSHQAEAWCE
jgi:hypothetical protein